MTEESAAPDQPGKTPERVDAKNMLPVVITVAVLGLMAVVIAIDASSVPGLAVASLLIFGGLIATIAAFN